ncbi:16S rRNA (guanine(966)-N(2))-methyltransferase RsmD [Novosphingobium sp.]|uniref:16S rRNA (guanine(966)-N(2))-methyltransferase RsmD n=1 Tax=Novosphingobium sp. TaxID=1874826 RepID=UPI003342BD5C
MRIIAGDWRGRKLIAPVGDTTRPTADRTRETLFSMLVSRLGDFSGLAVGDLFAGSGALGLEALSRGAGSALLVESDAKALAAIRTNITSLDAGARATVRAGSVLALGPARSAFDLVLMDPPYRSGAGVVAIDKLTRLGWIGPATWISLETALDEAIEITGCTIDVERKVGKAKITLLRVTP